MTEPIGIRLIAAGNFNGNTPITLVRDRDFTISGGRIYTANAPVAGGVIPADLFGFFAPEAFKLVGVAVSSYNPLNRVGVLDAAGRLREEFTPTANPQYVLMHAQDTLAVLTKDSTLAGGPAPELMLFPNEMNEHEHVDWAENHPPVPNHLRLRIIRDTGTAFQINANTIWVPTFQWDPTINVLVAHDNGTGAIPIPAICHPKHCGCFISLRYGNSNTNGKVVLVEPITRATWIPQNNMHDVEWSKVQYLSHDDLLALEASTQPQGGKLVCDIEVVRVEPGDRMRHRYGDTN